MKPESYLMQERRLLENHIQAFFGRFEAVLHESLSPDISTDICVIPPSEKCNYYTLVSLGESATLPSPIPERRKKDRILPLLFLPADWNPGDSSKEQRWPVRLLARLTAACSCSSEPMSYGSVLKTVPPFQEEMPMYHALLITPLSFSPDACSCRLPEGKTVHFYQALPLYPDEAEYVYAVGAAELLNQPDIRNFITLPFREDLLDRDEISQEEADGSLLDDASWHLESIQEKQLPADTLSACSHMAAWLHWAQKHQFLNPALSQKIPDDFISLREFILKQLDGLLLCSYFVKDIQDFADSYYSGENGPCFLSDLEAFAQEYSHSSNSECASFCASFPEEAYLFLPYCDDYIHSISRIIEQRWEEWKQPDIHT